VSLLWLEAGTWPSAAIDRDLLVSHLTGQSQYEVRMGHAAQWFWNLVVWRDVGRAVQSWPVSRSVCDM